MKLYTQEKTIIPVKCYEADVQGTGHQQGRPKECLKGTKRWSEPPSSMKIRVDVEGHHDSVECEIRERQRGYEDVV